MIGRKIEPFTAFNQTRLVPVEVYVNGELVDGSDYQETLWMERGEDWYAFMNDKYRDKRVRVVKREAWLKATPLDEVLR
jgi:hypothetical protein